MTYPNSSFPGRVRRFRPFTNLSEGTPCHTTGGKGGALVTPTSERPVPYYERLARPRPGVGGHQGENAVGPMLFARDALQKLSRQFADADQAVCSSSRVAVVHAPDNNFERIRYGRKPFRQSRKADGLHR